MLQNLIFFFEKIEPLQRLMIFLSVLSFFSLIEFIIPLRDNKRSRRNHLTINLFLTTTTFIINAGLAFILLATSQWVTDHQFGISNLLFSKNVYLHLVSSILILDLVGAYTPHFIEHKVKYLWQFHVIHHTDTIIDVTTGHRHHPGESIIRFGFTTLAVLISGAGIAEVMLYQTLSSFFAMWAHANIRLPKRADKLLSYIFVTPNLHRIHHHIEQPLSDKNMGNMISLWDRLFGTFAYFDEKTIIFGTDTYPLEKENNNLKFLMKLPFLGYRLSEYNKKKEVKLNR